MWEEYNPNPMERRVGDCTVRAIAKALDLTWEEAYVKLAVQGFLMCNMPSGDEVWGSLLRQHGFSRKSIPNTCPDCYTAEEFCNDFPEGTYVLSFGGHVATVQDGTLYDSENSLHDVPIYYWYFDEETEEEKEDE